MIVGETYFIQDHLWVVCTSQDENGRVAILNMTTWRRGCDENCVIVPGDHSWVKHPTVIAYERGKMLDKKQQAAIYGMPSVCPRKASVSAELLKRVQDGALKSDLTPQEIQVAIKAHLSAQKPSGP